MTQRRKLRAAGQTKSNVSLPPNELEGWTSQGPPRRAPQTHSTSTSTPRKPRGASSLYPLKKQSGQKKKKGENYIPRPSNSFILFRRHFVAEFKANGSRVSPDTNLSKITGDAWNSLSETEKAKWEIQAKDAKRQHAIAHPGYKYQPRRANARPKVQSREDRQIEESSVIFHSSAESSPAPSSSADSPRNDNDAPPPPVPPVNTFRSAPVHSRFIQRKQSLRLSNWDDSVLYPQGSSSSNFFGAYSYPDPIPPPQSDNSALIDFQSHNWNLDALQRRSSSAPIPLPIPATSYYPNSENVHAYDDHSGRLSYSGIRPGFAFQNMEPLESSSTLPASLPQVVVTGPSHESFRDHQISYPEVNNTTNPAMFVSPSQDMSSISHFDMDNFGLGEWSYTHSPEDVYSASESSPSVSNLTPSPMLSFEEFMSANSSPGDLFGQVESIKFDVSQKNLGQGFLRQTNKKDSNTRREPAIDGGCLDSDFTINLDPRLLDLSATPPGDAFTDFCYTQDSGTDFDSTWDLFEVK